MQNQPNSSYPYPQPHNPLSHIQPLPATSASWMQTGLNNASILEESNPGVPQYMPGSFLLNPFMQQNAGGSFFQGSSNFVMNQPHMVHNNIQNMNMFFGQGVPVLNRLYAASMRGTEINSKARHPPRCAPGTRQTITRQISDWIDDPRNDNRRFDLLWLYGFAGVGKTAVAQTVGECARESATPVLGAAFFFSRTRNQNDPTKVFASIAYQLSIVNESYRRLVNHQLAEDLSLLEKDIRTQFKKLLVEPLSELTGKLERKLLIIIDGLDECAGYEEGQPGDAAQCEIIDLVSEAASRPSRLPVIWMICSRPESHIKRKFGRDTDIKIDCWRNELRVDDSEARRDIELFLREQFNQIREVYHVDAQEDGSWPAAGLVDKVVSAASGLFVYASTVSKFLSDPNVADPDFQLMALITFIDDSLSAKDAMASPLHYLDKLYEQILSDVQPQLLQLALQILGTSFLYPALPILQLANLFGLSQAKFYNTLLRLHSVIDIPPPDKASRDSLSFFHTSFVDFLKNPNQSGKFTIYPYRIHVEFAKACFGILNQTKLRFAKNLAWRPGEGDIPAFSVAHQMLLYATAHVWVACTNLGDGGDISLFDVIVNFRYPFLRFIEDKIPVPQFSSFVQWLIKQIRIHHIQDIVQAIKWKDDYLEETLGPTAIDKSGNNVGVTSLASFSLGKENKCVTVMLGSDFIVLSCED